MMDIYEIKALELTVEALDTVIAKCQKKAEKERSKINKGYITYKGERYETEDDIFDAYACDVISSDTADKLVEKLQKAKGVSDANEMTESEKILNHLQMFKSNIQTEIAHDNQKKVNQERKDARVRELVAEGHSFEEAVTIMGNEELMRYE